MEPTNISDIIKWSGGRLVSGEAIGQISSACIDSRKIEHGGLFIPLKGSKFDGHDFVCNAFANGANACLISDLSVMENQQELKSSDKILILVQDTKKALQSIAMNYRKKFDIPVIGVTGSVGKSTTSEMIASVLAANFKVLKTQDNYNGQFGLPLTLLSLDSSSRAAVLEMGISEFGEMEKLAKVANPNIAVVTNIGLSHIANFKTQENIREEKLKIINNYDGKYYLNGDNSLLSNVNRAKFKDVTYFGLNGNYPYSAVDIFSRGDSTEFALITPEFKDNMVIPCLGIHNVYNALAAIAIAVDMGMHLQDIKNGFLNFQGIPQRLQIEEVNGVTIIDDSYNSSPDSVKSAVSVLRSLKNEGKNIVVVGDMLELGENSAKLHYNMGKYIAMENIDVLIAVGDLSKFIYEGIKDSGRQIKAIWCPNNQSAICELKAIVSSGDKILTKASHAMHMNEVARGLKEWAAKEM